MRVDIESNLIFLENIGSPTIVSDYVLGVQTLVWVAGPN
jgi:hypothetical protein